MTPDPTPVEVSGAALPAGARQTPPAPAPALAAPRAALAVPAWTGVLVAAAGTLVLLALPFAVGPQTIRLLTTLFMFAALTASWNLIGGLAGYISFGHVVFYGVGAYTAAMAMIRFGVPFAVGLGLSGIVVLFFALLISPVLRLRGHYFAIITYGVAEATREIVNNVGFTGGGKGVTLPLLDWTIRTAAVAFYLAMLGLLLVAMAVTYGVARSRLGYALKAIRADEEAAAVMGINTARVKTAVFLLSAVLTGFVGAVYARWISYIDPVTVFDPLISVATIVMAYLGGAGTLLGPLVGALVVQLVGDLLLERFLELHSAVLGLLVIVTVMFVPGGLMSLVAGRQRRARPRRFRDQLARYQV